MTRLGRLNNITEEHHVIFAGKVIQHPALQRICRRGDGALFYRAVSGTK